MAAITNPIYWAAVHRSIISWPIILGHSTARVNIQVTAYQYQLLVYAKIQDMLLHLYILYSIKDRDKLLELISIIILLVHLLNSTYKRGIPERQWRTEISSTTLSVGFPCLGYEKSLGWSSTHDGISHCIAWDPKSLGQSSNHNIFHCIARDRKSLGQSSSHNIFHSIGQDRHPLLFWTNSSGKILKMKWGLNLT